MTHYQGSGFRITIPHAINAEELETGNADLHVTLRDGRRYAGTVFTLANIARLMAHYGERGGFANGLYFWATNMIITKDLSEFTLVAAVSDLILSNDIEKVFCESRL